MKKTPAICILSLVTALTLSTCVQAQTKTVLVSKNVKGLNWDPDIATDGKGHAIAVWVKSSSDDTSHQIYAAFLKIKGKKVRVAKSIRLTGDSVLSKSPSIRYQELSNSYLVAWEASGEENYSIRTRELDAAGKPVGDEKELVSSPYERFFAPILHAIEGARKTNKSYIIVWYRTASETTDTGLWSAVLSSKGDITKKPNMVLPAINVHHGGLQANPTCLTAMLGGGFLLGVSRVESDDSSVQRGLLVQLSKAGKKKKVIPLQGGDKVTYVTCKTTADESILVSWYRYTDGAVFNQVFNSSFSPLANAVRIYQDICNGSELIRVGARLFQAFSVNYYGFFSVEFDENGSALSEPAFVSADQSLSLRFGAAGDGDNGRIWFATSRKIPGGSDYGIYCIVYTVPDA